MMHVSLYDLFVAFWSHFIFPYILHVPAKVHCSQTFPVQPLCAQFSLNRPPQNILYRLRIPSLPHLPVYTPFYLAKFCLFMKILKLKFHVPGDAFLDLSNPVLRALQQITFTCCVSSVILSITLQNYIDLSVSSSTLKMDCTFQILIFLEPYTVLVTWQALGKYYRMNECLIKPCYFQKIVLRKKVFQNCSSQNDDMQKFGYNKRNYSERLKKYYLYSHIMCVNFIDMISNIYRKLYFDIQMIKQKLVYCLLRDEFFFIFIF